jgi:hypothetical protein
VIRLAHTKQTKANVSNHHLESTRGEPLLITNVPVTGPFSKARRTLFSIGRTYEKDDLPNPIRALEITQHKSPKITSRTSQKHSNSTRRKVADWYTLYNVFVDSVDIVFQLRIRNDGCSKGSEAQFGLWTDNEHGS